MLHPTFGTSPTKSLYPRPAVGGSSELVLVVEDEAIIGLDLCESIDSLGYLAAGPFTHCRDALAWLQRFTPCSAILDYALRDGFCMELARELKRRCIPFVIHSGHWRERAFAAEFPNAPWIDKPASPVSVLRALETIAPTPPLQLEAQAHVRPAAHAHSDAGLSDEPAFAGLAAERSKHAQSVLETS